MRCLDRHKSLGVVGLVSNRLVEARHRFVKPVEFGKRDALIVLCIRLVRINFECLRNQPLAFDELTALYKNNPQKVDGIEIIGIELEKLTI